MKPHSNDLRCRVIDAYDGGAGPMRRMAERFSVSLDFVWRLVKRWRETDQVDPKPHGGGQPPKIDGERLERLRSLLEKDRSATLAELRDAFVRDTGVKVSTGAVSRALRRLNVTRKKISYHASEREGRDDVKEQRRDFLREAGATKDVDHYVFVDESGMNLGMARHYGRAALGQRATGVKPANPGSNYSLIGAMSPAGVTAAMVIEGATDAQVFETFVEDMLAPTLRPGDRVWIDRLPAHMAAVVEPALLARGASLQLLPAHSPDLSPIELCWSKVKEKLRTAAARTYDALIAAVKEALESITPAEARHWFHRCGFCAEPG